MNTNLETYLQNLEKAVGFPVLVSFTIIEGRIRFIQMVDLDISINGLGNEPINQKKPNYFG